MTYVRPQHKPIPSAAVILRDPTKHYIDHVKYAVTAFPGDAQWVLEAEQKRQPRPRYTLITWLKRHRLHNPTVRVIPNR